MKNPVPHIEQALTAVLASEGITASQPLSKSDHAHYQSNVALSNAKALGVKPRDLAERIAAKLNDENLEASVAGPGFININLRPAFINACLNAPPVEDKTPGKTVIIDYGGPNVAKPLHVGHLRSLIIGQSLARIMFAKGDTVTTDAHLGDWGLQIGLLMATIREAKLDVKSLTPADLEVMYPAASARAKEDAEFRREAQMLVAEMQGGERRGLTLLWKAIIDISKASLEADIAALGVEFDLWNGESATVNTIPPMINELQEKGLAQESEGALIMPFGVDTDLPPLILRNSEGGALYGTTDLATIKDRAKEKPDMILYVVDQRQALHFKQVFLAAEKAGYADGIQLEHLGFGTVNGPDGKPLKTRDGGVPKLNDLITAAREKAYERLPEDRKDWDIANAIALAALKFADLQNPRTTSYVFDLDQFLRFEGKTGPYVVYQAVRIGSILRQKTVERGEITITEPEEAALAMVLLDFDRVMELAYRNRAPDIIAQHAYLLAQAFSRFYKQHRVADNASRVGLAHQVMLQLDDCLWLLGIKAPERM